MKPKEKVMKQKPHPVMRVVNAMITLFMILSLLVLGLSVVSALKKGADRRDKAVLGFLPLIIESGSMETTIAENSVVFLKVNVTMANIKRGDIIAFESMDVQPAGVPKSADTGKSKWVCHRVIKIDEKGSLYTQGDNVTVEDGIPIGSDRFIGVIPENRLHIWNWVKPIVQDVRNDDGSINTRGVVKYLLLSSFLVFLFVIVFAVLNRIFKPLPLAETPFIPGEEEKNNHVKKRMEKMGFQRKKEQTRGQAIQTQMQAPIGETAARQGESLISRLRFSKEGNAASNYLRMASWFVVAIMAVLALFVAGWLVMRMLPANSFAGGYKLVHIQDNAMGAELYQKSDVLVKKLEPTYESIFNAFYNEKDHVMEGWISYTADGKIITRQIYMLRPAENGFTVRAVKDIFPDETVIPYSAVVGKVTRPMNWTAQIYWDLDSASGVFKWIALPLLLAALLFILLRLLANIQITAKGTAVPFAVTDPVQHTYTSPEGLVDLFSDSAAGAMQMQGRQDPVVPATQEAMPEISQEPVNAKAVESTPPQELIDFSEIDFDTFLQDKLNN